MSKIQILVVDDKPRYLKLVRYNLEAAGYEVLTAASGKEAVSTVAGTNPDLIILDIRLPGINGYEVCTRIREFSSTPIITLTVKGEEPEKVQGLRLGADDYITKPFGSEELVAQSSPCCDAAVFLKWRLPLFSPSENCPLISYRGK